MSDAAPFEPLISDLPPAEGAGVELVKQATLTELRARCVEMRVAGADYGKISTELGISIKDARGHCDAWVRSRRPANELTDELTKLSDARLEILHEVWWPRALEGDERALNAVLKILDQRARIMGLEIKKPSSVTIVTAEAIVEVLGLGRGVSAPAAVTAESGPVTRQIAAGAVDGIGFPSAAPIVEEVTG